MFGRRRHRTAVTTAPSRHGHGHHHHTVTTTTTTAPRRRGLFSRRRREPVVVHHQKRHTTLGDKISGAFLRLKGSITGRPGQKAAGTRRMHGTDGLGARRRRYY